ncbi:hypothetical protein GCM10010210_00620 [Pseudonocardia hydrocarbonoxydans]|uniref:DUF1059 domain-containing protein n=2 Tax=Pseudonocardia hydrocarbonoxydans TaxID=76726 RepID=A0A4Y3WJ75_9PSEU|nr:hypothetical protein PHY01_12700 [Pseudonocardia hydrocarbonoxydans]
MGDQVGDEQAGPATGQPGVDRAAVAGDGEVPVELDAHRTIVTTSRQRGDTLAAIRPGTLAAPPSTAGPPPAPAHEESVMLNQVSCECGYQAREDDEAAVIRTVQQHVRDSHPELVDQVTPDVIRGWIELVP